MKKIIGLLALVGLSSNGLAQDRLIKECSVNWSHAATNTVMDFKVKILDKGSNNITRIISQQQVENEVSLSVFEANVRPNLTVNIKSNDLNEAEALIVQAMELEALPEDFSSGIDLKEVRSAKGYYTDNSYDNIMIEARDEKNQVLGWFLAGLTIFPCK